MRSGGRFCDGDIAGCATAETLSDSKNPSAHTKDKRIRWAEQIARCMRNSAVIEPTWNVQRFQTAKERAAETRADRKWGKPTPRMIHYIGTDKPWARNVWHPWAWAYWENLRRTPYLKEVQATYRMDTAQLLRLRLRWLLRRPAGSFLQ